MSKGGFALLSLFYKIDRSAQKLTAGRIHSFDIRRSTFVIRFSLFYKPDNGLKVVKWHMKKQFP